MKCSVIKESCYCSDEKRIEYAVSENLVRGEVNNLSDLEQVASSLNLSCDIWVDHLVEILVLIQARCDSSTVLGQAAAHLVLVVKL